jgi:hypothetical protein
LRSKLRNIPRGIPAAANEGTVESLRLRLEVRDELIGPRSDFSGDFDVAVRDVRFSRVRMVTSTSSGSGELLPIWCVVSRTDLDLIGRDGVRKTLYTSLSHVSLSGSEIRPMCHPTCAKKSPVPKR